MYSNSKMQYEMSWATGCLECGQLYVNGTDLQFWAEARPHLGRPRVGGLEEAPLCLVCEPLCGANGDGIAVPPQKSSYGWAEVGSGSARLPWKHIFPQNRGWLHQLKA